MCYWQDASAARASPRRWQFRKSQAWSDCNKLDEFHYVRRLTSNAIIASLSGAFTRDLINRDNGMSICLSQLCLILGKVKSQQIVEILNTLENYS